MDCQNAKNIQNKFKREFLKYEREDFDYESCLAWLKLTERFWKKINHEYLLNFAEVISMKLGIKIFRYQKRKKEMLINWFNNNFDQIWPFIETHILIINMNNTNVNYIK